MSNDLRTKSNLKSNNFSGDIADIELEIAYVEPYSNENLDLDNFDDIESVEILNERKFKNGTLGIEGELLINSDSNTLISLDIDGTLNIASKDSDSYSINEMGELIKTL